jgi:hypothetical protein
VKIANIGSQKRKLQKPLKIILFYFVRAPCSFSSNFTLKKLDLTGASFKMGKLGSQAAMAMAIFLAAEQKNKN